MPHLTQGLYESLVTEFLADRLAELAQTDDPDIDALRNAEAADPVIRQIEHCGARILLPGSSYIRQPRW